MDRSRRTDGARASGGELDALWRLAAALGVEAHYVDGLGMRRTTPPETLVAVLAALGAPVARVADANDAVRWVTGRPAPVVPPVLVAWIEQPLLVPVRTGIEAGRLRAVLRSDDGVEQASTFDLQTLDRGADGTVVLPLTPPPTGRHRLEVELSAGRGAPATTAGSWVLAAPGRTHPGPFDRRPRPWGVFLPLAAAWSERSWGVGDIGDLAHLGRWLHGRGGAVLGTLPLLATWSDPPVDPSPYAPVSRRFWNELHLDLDRVDPALWTPEATRLAAALGPALRATCRPDSPVDHAAVLDAKHRVLAAMVPALDRLPPGPAGRLADFLARRPDTARYAAFRANAQLLGRNRSTWPPEARAGALVDASEAPTLRDQHVLAQWLVDEQLREVATELRSRDQALYLDLPLGSHPDGFDLFEAPEHHAAGVSLGAPPDAFFAAGQDWGLPPRLPDVGAIDGHAELAAVVDHHLAHADVLRIDHVLALHRQYWIPIGADATDGAYVRSPSDQLVAVLAAASHRHRAAIVGENLGTVPPEVDALLDAHGIAGMHVAQFAIGSDPRRPVRRPKPGAVASFSTHDLPPFAAWWSGADIDERRDLGLSSPELDERSRAERSAARAVLAPEGAPSEQVLHEVLATLGVSDAALVLVDVEDLWGEATATNVPGTTDERPNWRRRARHGIDVLDEVPGVAAGLDLVARSRRAATSGARWIGLLGDQDLHLFNEGRHHRLHERLGAHPVHHDGVPGTHFAVWAPNARRVSVVGSFNEWDDTRHALSPVGSSGIWAGWVGGAGHGDLYRYRIWSRHGGYRVDKADPFAFSAETAPGTASIIWEHRHDWGDGEWLARRADRQGPDRPMSIYEVHLGSWRRVPEEGDRPLGYRELGPLLADHCVTSGFTHVELMPVMEHPFYGSWGYQVTGYFAPTGRYGTPDDLMAMIDHLHQRGIGVILDWVPSHFPSDEHGLGYFDGTFLYEHADPRQRIHPEWTSLQFNYGRHEVRSFLVSNAVHWLERFHADGLRVDAVASMLYLDYGRRPGEWVPNPRGGRENLDAVTFLQELNTVVHAVVPGVVTIAEESTAWPGVSRPVHHGGLGFDRKWDMGWMHDTLAYLARDPVHRRWHHRELTFRSLYQFSEHFVLPLSHDEVVHGKGSLLGKLPGDEWQRFANLRLLFGYQWTVPGMPLLFMGQEWGPYVEWDHDRSLPWHLLEYESHAGAQRWVAACNRLLRDQPALSRLDNSPSGFCWVDADDAGRSLLSWLRFADDGTHPLLVVLNATPAPRDDVVLGVPRGGSWRVLANSDDPEYWGSGHPVPTRVEASGSPAHGQPDSLRLSIPPLAVVVLGPD